MENNNRESLFANAARETFGSIGRFAKDLYSAISENSRTSKDIDKANSSDDVYEKKIKSQENKLNDLLERSQYLNNLISRQFKELISNLKSFLNSVTGGLGLGALGGILGTAVAADFFGDSQVEEIDLYDEDPESESPAGDYDPESPENPETPRNNNNFEGEPLSDDLAAPLEGAEGVDVEFSPGPRRPNPPSYGVVNAVRNAVFSTFGEGYRIVITSGEGEHGSERHREAAGGAAIDYKIVDPDGNPVNINDPRIRDYLKSLGEQGIKGHGMGREYMGEHTMHSDIFPREDYTGGMGPTWGDGWMDNEILEPGQKSLRQTFLDASSGVETPRTGGSVEIQDGMVRLPTLEEFIQELSPEEPVETQEEITPTPETPVSAEPVSETPVPETPVSAEPVSETPTPETPVSAEPVSETPAPVTETPEPASPESARSRARHRARPAHVPETPEPAEPVSETPEIVTETPAPETPAPEPVPETPETVETVTEAIPVSNTTSIDVEDTDQRRETPIPQNNQTEPAKTTPEKRIASSDPSKLSDPIKNFLHRSDYKVEQEPTYA